MASNQDILAFLQSDQEARIKEKRKRSQEKKRQEDMIRILDMLKSGVKKEVMAAMQPAEDRLAQQEKVIGELSRQLNTIMEEMENLKESTKYLTDFPALPAQQVPDKSRDLCDGKGQSRSMKTWIMIAGGSGPWQWNQKR